MIELNWTQELPTEEGYYLVDNHGDDCFSMSCYIVYFLDGLLHFDGEDVGEFLAKFGDEKPYFAGPINRAPVPSGAPFGGKDA